LLCATKHWHRRFRIGGQEGRRRDAARRTDARGICIAPQYVVSDLLNGEGFTNVEYVESDADVGQSKAIANGDVDFSLNFSAPIVLEIDRGLTVTVLAGIHVGCFELFAREGIRSIADLKGRTVGIQGLGTSPHVFLSAMAPLVDSILPRTSNG
jgi:NitT/TauT family transport system substrate-binding protein